MGTAPFWVAILGYLVNREAIKWQLILCMIGCFLGVMALNFGSTDKEPKDGKVESSKVFSHYTLGIMGAILMVLLSALQQVLTRKIRTIHFSIMQANYAF